VQLADGRVRWNTAMVRDDLDARLRGPRQEFKTVMSRLAMIVSLSY